MTTNSRGVEDVSENPKSFIDFVRHTVLGTAPTTRKVVHTDADQSASGAEDAAQSRGGQEQEDGIDEDNTTGSTSAAYT